ncbi:MAG: TerD family protein, partial [Ruminococcus sp.]|nr:TerD family protein [Ruminococcus sp.]
LPIYNGAWKFNAIGDGTKDTSLKTLSAKYR